MMQQNIANSNDHGIFTQYGFLLSATNPPTFSVPHYQRHNESVRVDYWHPNKDYVIHILNHGNGCTVDECYYVMRRNGTPIKELYDYAAVSDFFGNNIEFINSQQYNSNPVAVSQVNNPSWQNLPQQPYPIQNQVGHFTQPQYPQPAFDINHFLNARQLTNHLNLQSIIPYNHVINKMASYLHKEFPLPLSTLILVGLGVASGMTARKWNCAYHTRGTSPICLYVVAEQKSGKGKTTALNTFQEPLRNIVNELIKKIKCEIEVQTDNLAYHLNKEADDLSVNHH